MRLRNSEILDCVTRELQDLKMENENMKGLLSGIDKTFADVVDRAAAESAEKNYILRYTHNLKKINSLEQALANMEKESYGLCRRCGETIGLRRLLAIPDALHCIGCQNELDSM
ncbi:MAG: TraR/DksA family transcriptional regulator [Desulfohalobiaceae bacterium]|jgi:RNA polymerase-binding protein DksA|nr:TraR/DksA family transcriptional regulator [Desulfohalobiaceae bacterium]